MTERVVPGRADGLITVDAADALWVGLTAGGAVPTASGAFTRSPARARTGYVLLGSRVVATARVGGGRWGVAEREVRRAAAELNAVVMDRRDLVRVGPFRGAPEPEPEPERDEETPLRWRWRVAGELGEPGGGRDTARGRPAVSSGGDRLATATRGARSRRDPADVVAAARGGEAARRGRARRDAVAASRADP
ncbi:hypothetical protein [Streptomyces sp. NPDC053755]|uniref:hypothetical protein n=1 Tax=Streptomyces sp. NPDC053755 TaxID=3155815 RepID=UPI00341DCCA5